MSFTRWHKSPQTRDDLVLTDYYICTYLFFPAVSLCIYRSYIHFRVRPLRWHPILYSHHNTHRRATVTRTLVCNNIEANNGAPWSSRPFNIDRGPESRHFNLKGFGHGKPWHMRSYKIRTTHPWILCHWLFCWTLSARPSKLSQWTAFLMEGSTWPISSTS